MGTFKYVVTRHATEKAIYDLAEKTPDAFIEAMLKRGHKVGDKDGSGIIAATFAQGARLMQVNLQTVTGLIVDVDGKFKKDGEIYYAPVDPEWVLSRLPFRGLAHTSHSHTPDLPKYRVILPLEQEIAPHEFARLWWWVFEQLEKKSDPSTKNPDRMFFLPRGTQASLDAGIHWMRELQGPLLSLQHVPESYQPPEAYTPTFKPKQGLHVAPKESFRGLVDTEALLEKLMELPLYRWALENPDDVGREVWRGLATNIAAAVLEDEAAYAHGGELFHELSEPYSGYSRGETEKVWRDALKSAATYGPMTYATMKHNGAPDDCDVGTDYKSPVAQARKAVSRERGYIYKDKDPKVEAPVAGAESAPAAGAAPSAASTKKEERAPTGGGDDDDGDGDEGWRNIPFEEQFIYDAENGKYLKKNAKGKYSTEYSETAFNQILLAHKVPRKKIDLVKARLTVFDYRAAIFDSNDQLVQRDGLLVFNTYVKSALKPQAGAWDDIRELIYNLAGRENGALEYTLDWLALPVQKVHIQGLPYKLGSAPIFEGDPGSGKGTLWRIMQLIYGESNCMELGQGSLEGKFNAEIIDKLFVVANEVVSSTNRTEETANKLKPWVTDEQIPVERKHKDLKLVPNYFNIMFTSNNEVPVKVDKGDRRYSVFKSQKLDETVAARLHADLGSVRNPGPLNQVRAFMEHLLTRQTKIKYGQLYETKAKQDLIQRSTHMSDLFIQDVKEYGWLSVASDWAEDRRENDPPREMTVAGDVVLSKTVELVYTHYCRQKNQKAYDAKHITGKLARSFGSEPKNARVPGLKQCKAIFGVPMQGSLADVIPLNPPPQGPPKLPKDAPLEVPLEELSPTADKGEV